MTAGSGLGSLGMGSPGPLVDAHQPAVVLATVKDKPFGRPQERAVLDRRSARQPHHHAGRDGRMAPPGGEPKNATKLEDKMTLQPLL
jgi:hypothetical protein